MRKNRKLIALFAGLSLALLSSPALAYPSADTVLVSGYDADEMVVLYGVSDIDDDDAETASLDCSLDGDYVYEADLESLEDDETSETEVTGLWEDGADYDSEAAQVEFDYEDGDGSETYGTEDADECQLTAVQIEPNGAGKITHGTIVSTFAKLLGGGNGCLIRHFAQSDYGKMDFDDFDDETLDEGQFAVTLEYHETACEKGRDVVDDDSVSGDDDDSSRGGPPPWAGPKGDRDTSDKPGKGNRPAHAGDDSSS